MRTNLAQSLTGLLVCASLAAPVLAAPPVHDYNFMKNAAQDGNFEVATGKLAESNGGSRGVRQFGLQMVHDHSQANHDLKRIASSEGVALPTGLGPVNQAIYNHLSTLHGKAFDASYQKVAIAGHVKDLNAMQKEAATGKNAPVRTFAQKYAPVVQGHLMMARQLNTKDGRMGT